LAPADRLLQEGEQILRRAVELQEDALRVCERGASLRAERAIEVERDVDRPEEVGRPPPALDAPEERCGRSGHGRVRERDEQQRDRAKPSQAQRTGTTPGGRGLRRKLAEDESPAV